jgi:hypothetical protein
MSEVIIMADEEMTCGDLCYLKQKHKKSREIEEKLYESECECEER